MQVISYVGDGGAEMPHEGCGGNPEISHSKKLVV